MDIAPFPNAIGTTGCGSAWTRSPLGVSTDLKVSVFEPTLGYNISRGFRIHVPSTYKVGVAVPIVYDFHGFYDYANREETENFLSDIVGDEKGAIVVYTNGSWDDPLGIKEHPHFHPNSWNAMGTTGITPEHPTYYTETCEHNRQYWSEYRCYTSCQKRPAGCNQTKDCYSSSCQDDVGYFGELMNTLEGELCIDQNRIHATGISAGAIMVFQAAVSFSSRLASIVPVAGASLRGFNIGPSYPLSIMDIHGYTDTYVPANATSQYGSGPDGTVISADGMYYTSQQDTMKTWAQSLGCDNSGIIKYPTKYDGKRDWSCIKPHGNCASGTSLVTCAWQGGHNWPWIQHDDYDYARVTWDFFAAHPKAQGVIVQL